MLSSLVLTIIIKTIFIEELDEELVILLKDRWESSGSDSPVTSRHEECGERLLRVTLWRPGEAEIP